MAIGDKKTGQPEGPGPSSVTGSSQGSFASQGGYGRGPMGRGPYSQPNTFATNKADRNGPEAQTSLTEEAERSNAEGNAPRTHAQPDEALRNDEEGIDG